MIRERPVPNRRIVIVLQPTPRPPSAVLGRTLSQVRRRSKPEKAEPMPDSRTPEPGQNEDIDPRTRGAIAAKRTLQKRIFAPIEREDDPAIAERMFRAMLGEANPGLPKARIDAGVRRFNSRWFRYSLRHNPARMLQAFRCPALTLFGEKNVQVPLKGNREAIHD